MFPQADLPNGRNRSHKILAENTPDPKETKKISKKAEVMTGPCSKHQLPLVKVRKCRCQKTFEEMERYFDCLEDFKYLTFLALTI
jgi:hypothetical protein